MNLLPEQMFKTFVPSLCHLICKSLGKFFHVSFLCVVFCGTPKRTSPDEVNEKITWVTPTQGDLTSLFPGVEAIREAKLTRQIRTCFPLSLTRRPLRWRDLQVGKRTLSAPLWLFKNCEQLGSRYVWNLNSKKSKLSREGGFKVTAFRPKGLAELLHYAPPTSLG